MPNSITIITTRKLMAQAEHRFHGEHVKAANDLIADAVAQTEHLNHDDNLPGEPQAVADRRQDVRDELRQNNVDDLGPGTGVKDLAHVDQILVDGFGSLPDADGQHRHDGNGNRGISAGFVETKEHDHQYRPDETRHRETENHRRLEEASRGFLGFP